MDRPGKLPGGQISEVMNIHSRKLYMVSTAPEVGQDFWSTAILPMVEQKALFGLIKKNVPDIYHQMASFVRNRMEDAYEAHAQVRHVVISISEDKWFEHFPSPSPPDGYSEGARTKIRAHLGNDSHPAMTIERAKDLVFGFADIMGEKKYFIGDASTLPCPRAELRSAFSVYLNWMYAERDKDLPGFKRNGYDKVLRATETCSVMVDEFHDIAPEDLAEVQRINSLIASPNEIGEVELKMILKYMGEPKHPA
jgi:hypothetical protein